MTTNNNEVALATPGDDEPGGETPTFTWSDAKRSGLTTHEIFMLTVKIWKLVVAFHAQAGTPRDAWEPPEMAGSILGDFYNVKATERVETACQETLDPRVQSIEDGGNEVDTTVQAVIDRDPKLVSSETGAVFTEEEAVDQVNSNQDKVVADVKKGRSHHKRVPRWVRIVGKVTPYGEALGLVVLLAYWLNVNWLRPLDDPLTFTLAVVIVVATLIFTPRVDERSGEGWNGRRQAVADGHSEAAVSNTRKFAINGIIAILLCAVFVGGLVERALAATEDDTVPQSMRVLLIALCVAAGVAMPAFAWIAKAFDGSTQSRENDNLIAQLEDGRAEDQELRSAARAGNTACDQQESHVNTEVAPAIYRIASEVAEEERRAYGWLRVQIGGLPSAPPSRPVEELEASDLRRSISTGVPGAEPIRLGPLVDRGLRLAELKRRRAVAIARLDALPPHPWAGDEEA